MNFCDITTNIILYLLLCTANEPRGFEASHCKPYRLKNLKTFRCNIFATFLKGLYFFLNESFFYYSPNLKKKSLRKPVPTNMLFILVHFQSWKVGKYTIQHNCFLPINRKANKERQTDKIPGSFFQGCAGLWTAGCWLARRLHQLKASTAMDLGISIFYLISA